LSRLRWRDDGRIEYELKRRAPDGSTTLVCDPVEFLRKLTALIPPPLSHLTRYHGVFAAHHEWRNQIVPAARRDGQTTDNKAPDAAEAWGKPSADGAGEPPCSAAQQPDGSVLARYLDWAALLLRVFAVDVTQCPRCGSSLRILSVITQPDVIEGILHHLDLPTAPSSSSRAPPAQVDLPWDDGCM
jgi:hypothetical protein